MLNPTPETARRIGRRPRTRRVVLTVLAIGLGVILPSRLSGHSETHWKRWCEETQHGVVASTYTSRSAGGYRYECVVDGEAVSTY